MLTNPLLQALVFGKMPTTICEYSSLLAYRVYRHLSQVFQYRLSFSEVGLTDHLVLDLARFSRLLNSTAIRVYKTTWRVETVFGNDIDLFVRNPSGHYSWYALQAKVMAYTGHFKDLKVMERGELQQWHKLLLHERIYGSQSFYLLYTGRPATRTPLASPIWEDCRGVAPIGEYGLCLVQAQQMLRLVTRTTPLAFDEVFPAHAEPLRSLFCCPRVQLPTATTYSEQDIVTAAYRQVYAWGKNDDPYQGVDPTDNLLPDGFAPIRILIDPNPDVAKG